MRLGLLAAASDGVGEGAGAGADVEARGEAAVVGAVTVSLAAPQSTLELVMARRSAQPRSAICISNRRRFSWRRMK
jgi:hypothetical protein